MKNDIYLIGEIGYEVNLNTVIEAVASSDKSKPLNVHIHSIGGCVYDGLAIYNYLKGLEQEVNTHSSGLVASIASIIFLAGAKATRNISTTDSFLIHLPMNFGGGNAEDFEKTAKQLRKIENQLADIYALETDLTKEEALELMKRDEMLDVNFLKEKGFVSNIIEFKAVATLTNNNNKNDMADKSVTKDEVEGMFTKFFNKFFPSKPTNKIVSDANGVEIDFTELEADASPAVNDTATVDGANAEGEYVMPSGETYKFEAGVLTEIVEAEGDDDGDGDEDEMAALKAKNADLEAQLAAANALTAKNEKKITKLKTRETEIEASMTALKDSLGSEFTYNDKGHLIPKGDFKETRSIRGSK